MEKTFNDLAAAALEIISRASVDEDPSAEDMATALGRVPTLLADLLARNVILQPVYEPVPDAQFDHLSVLLADRIASRFTTAVPATDVAVAIDALRTLARINRGTRKTLRVDDALLRPRRGSFVRISG